MAAPKLPAGYVRQDFQTFSVYEVPGVEEFSEEELHNVCLAIQHAECTTALNTTALFDALQRIPKDRFADRFTRTPSLRSSRSRSLTLPLDEDADGVTGQGTDNKELTSIHDTASHEPRGNAAVESTTRRLQNGKTKAGRVLKLVSSRISKQSPKERGLRRRKLEQQHGAKCLGEKTGNSRKTRPVGPQDSNFTSPATFPIHQPDQPGNLNDQPNSPDQEVQSHRASIGLHPEGGQRVTRSRARAPESKLFTTRNAESLASSMAHKRSRQKPAQGARHSKQENRQKSSREDKTRSGRVSKRPERFGFT